VRTSQYVTVLNSKEEGRIRREGAGERMVAYSDSQAVDCIGAVFNGGRIFLTITGVKDTNVLVNSSGDNQPAVVKGRRSKMRKKKKW